MALGRANIFFLGSNELEPQRLVIEVLLLTQLQICMPESS